jgi:predicted RNase H-like HicB family nuclease
LLIERNSILLVDFINQQEQSTLSEDSTPTAGDTLDGPWRLAGDRADGDYPSIGEQNILTEYIDEALSRARYELIEDPDEPYFGEIPELPGVWASGVTLESCRAQLKEVIEGWILLGVKKSLPIRRLG